MDGTRVKREEALEVFPKVAEIIADALGRDAGEIAIGNRLIDDLGAESIDFLDVVYRLERTFRLKIPRGKIEAEVRGPLSEAEFEAKGVLTPAALERLRDYMSEVPPERIRSGLKVADIPRLFTVETFCKVVVRARRDGDSAS